jgi:hypothetical protein
MSERRYPKALILKDCTEVVLRPLGAADATAARRFFAALPEDNRW